MTVAAAAITGTLGTSAFPVGHVIQVVSTTFADKFTDNPSSAWIDIPGLALTITPTSSSNKIYLQTTIVGQSIQSVWCLFRNLRTRTGESVAVGVGNTRGSRTRASAGAKEATSYDVESIAFNFLDTPSDAAGFQSSILPLTYQSQVIGNGVIYVNSNRNDGDAVSNPSCISTITAWEIQG
jgi:hypothetical protein